jgi:hypothetical protein
MSQSSLALTTSVGEETFSMTTPHPVSGHGNVTASLSYSLDGGVTWTAVYAVTGSRAKQYDSITLPLTQDFTKVMIKAQCQVVNGIALDVDMNVYEVRIDYTT